MPDTPKGQRSGPRNPGARPQMVEPTTRCSGEAHPVLRASSQWRSPRQDGHPQGEPASHSRPSQRERERPPSATRLRLHGQVTLMEWNGMEWNLRPGHQHHRPNGYRRESHAYVPGVVASCRREGGIGDGWSGAMTAGWGGFPVPRSGRAGPQRLADSGHVIVKPPGQWSTPEVPGEGGETRN